jgi:hypothetical protein
MKNSDYRWAARVRSWGGVSRSVGYAPLPNDVLRIDIAIMFDMIAKRDIIIAA